MANYNYYNSNMSYNQSSAPYPPLGGQPPASQPGQAHAGASQSHMYAQNMNYNYNPPRPQPWGYDIELFWAWHDWYRDYLYANGLLAPGAPYPYAPFEPLVPYNPSYTRYPIKPSALNPLSEFALRKPNSWTRVLTPEIARATQTRATRSRATRSRTTHSRHFSRTSNQLHLATDQHRQSGMIGSVELVSNSVRSCRVNKTYRASFATSSSHHDVSVQHQEDEMPNWVRQPLIMLPAPEPTERYMAQAALNPEVVNPADKKLVILDLNGTLIFRPNPRRPRRMVARPSLQEFLHYLFSEFRVMVWSSAKPNNVECLVGIALQGYSTRLVGCWSRNSFRLSPKNYIRRVQVYKNLDWVWGSGDIQKKMEGYPDKKFSQENTILIDDSALKASGQPYNLLEIPAFEGETTGPDVLAEVAGYLEVLKTQQDVSKFISKQPFKADGTWKFDWKILGPMSNGPVMHEGPEADTVDEEMEEEMEEELEVELEVEPDDKEESDDEEEPQVTYVY